MMMGRAPVMPVVQGASGPAPADPNPPEPAVASGAHRTMLGIPAVSENRVPSNPPMAKIEMTKSGSNSQGAGGEKRTVLGIPGLGFSAQAASTGTPVTPPAPAPPPASAPPPVAAAPSSPPEAASSAPASFASGAYDDEPERSGGPSVPTVAIVAVGAGVALLAAAVALLYLFVFSGSDGLAPQLYPNPDGTGITAVFSFPGAPDGATIQVAQVTVPVQAGQARVDIPISLLSLGPNQLELLYVAPGKPPERHTFDVLLRHMVETDLSGLQAEPPSVSVQFRIAQGLKLSIEGNPVQVAGGVYVHKILLADLRASGQSTVDTAIGKLMFQISDENGASQPGQHLITVPLSKLQIDRPAPDSIVETTQLTCTGVVDRDATVQVNGQALGVTAVGFSTTVPLPTLGKHEIQVTARSPGKAPSTQTISVTRIESLASAIKDWSADIPKPEIDYPALGRDTNVHVGKKIRMTGRIVNINTEKGVTVFLLYVADGCPPGGRCAAYVVFRGDTDAGLQSWVDVYGIVRGTSAVDRPSGGKLDVPALDAAFVTKSVRKSTKKG
jgi:hypothetical protein